MRVGARVFVLLSLLAGLGFAAAGCGGGDGSPAVANVSQPSTTAAPAPQSGAAGGASAQGGAVGGRHGGGAQPFGMMVVSTEQGRRFSACMRRHGEPDFPDPDAQGALFVTGIDRNSPAFRSALSACRQLLPSGFGQAPTQARLEQVQQRLLAFSRCMRAHGIEDFPDPSGGALPRIQGAGDLDPNDARFRAAYGACHADLPAGVPVKALGGLTAPATAGSGG